MLLRRSAKPPIIDEYITKDGFPGQVKAIGATNVRAIAKGSEADSAARASTNGDSYAMLLNSIYW
jgi:hypothetical protein